MLPNLSPSPTKAGANEIKKHLPRDKRGIRFHTSERADVTAKPNLRPVQSADSGSLIKHHPTAGNQFTAITNSPNVRRAIKSSQSESSRNNKLVSKCYRKQNSSGLHSRVSTKGSLAPIQGSGVLRKQEKDERRRKQKRKAAQTAAEARAATTEAVNMSKWESSLFGLAATKAGQDTPPMSAGSAVSLARNRQSGVASPSYVSPYKEWNTASPPLSASYCSTISIAKTKSSSKRSHRRKSKHRKVKSQAIIGYDVPCESRLRTPDLDILQSALHGSLFQRLKTNFSAGLVGNDLRQSGDVKGLRILDALTTNLAEEEEDELGEVLQQANEGDMAYYDNLVLAGLPAQPEAWEKNARFSRQGFPSTTPRPGSALSMLLSDAHPDSSSIRSAKHAGKKMSRRRKRTKEKRRKPPAKIRNAAGRVIPQSCDMPPPVDPAFSTKLLAAVNPKLYWDVKSASHEVKYAAIEFQRLVRGHLARLYTAEFRYHVMLQRMKRAHAAATKLQALSRGFLKRYSVQDIVLASPAGVYLTSSPTLCTEDPYRVPLLHLFDWIRRVEVGPLGFQKLWRGMIGRRQALGHKLYVLRCRLEKKMSSKIQACWRGCVERPKFQNRVKKVYRVRDWMRERVTKLRAIRLGEKVRADYLQKRQAAIYIQRWFPRAVETRGLARKARATYLELYAANIVCQSFVRMIISINTLNYLSAVREQERLAERRRIERERLEELERQRMERRASAALVIQKWVRPKQARVRVQILRERRTEREMTYQEAVTAWNDLMSNIGGHEKITRKTVAAPPETLIYMQCEVPIPGVTEDMALVEGHVNSGPGGENHPSLGLDDWYYHNLMTQPNSALLHYGRALLEFYRTGDPNSPVAKERLRAGRIVDPGLYHQRRFMDIYETAWRYDMDNAFKGCCYALARMLFLGDVLGAAKAMRRARINVTYNQLIVKHATKFEKDYAALVARGDHFVDHIYETAIILPPGRDKFRIQVLQHGRNLQFRSLRYDFVTSGVKPSGAESRLVFARPDIEDICMRLDRPELLRAGRVRQLVESLVPMLFLATGNSKKNNRSRSESKGKGKGITKKKGRKQLTIKFKQEPFPKMTVLTKGRGNKSLREKFLTIITLHRADGGFDLWAKGDMTSPPTQNPNDDYKLILPFKKLKRLFLDYPVLWQARKYPGWRARSDKLLAMIVERIEIAEKPKPEKKGVHQMSFDELMRMSHAVAKQEAALAESAKSRKGVEVVDCPPELVMLYFNEKGRIQQAEKNWGAMCLQKCWHGLVGRRKAKLQRAHLASLEITHFLFRQRARVWLREVYEFSRRHFSAIRIQKCIRGTLARLNFSARLKYIFPFSRGTWSVVAPAMVAQRPSPVSFEDSDVLAKIGVQKYTSIGSSMVVNKLFENRINLSELTHRVMWAIAVQDDDKGALSILKHWQQLSTEAHSQPNLIYAFAITTRLLGPLEETLSDQKQCFLDAKNAILEARRLDPDHGRKFDVCRSMFFECWRKIQTRNPLKFLRCAIMYEIVYDDFKAAEQSYTEARRLLDKCEWVCPTSTSYDEARRLVDGNYALFKEKIYQRHVNVCKIQTVWRGHCNKRVHGEWLAALIKFRKDCSVSGFSGALTKALGFHYLWHDHEKAHEHYLLARKFAKVGLLFKDLGKEWLQEQYSQLDKHSRGGINEKQFRDLAVAARTACIAKTMTMHPGIPDSKMESLADYSLEEPSSFSVGASSLDSCKETKSLTVDLPTDSQNGDANAKEKLEELDKTNSLTDTDDAEACVEQIHPHFVDKAMSFWKVVPKAEFLVQDRQVVSLESFWLWTLSACPTHPVKLDVGEILLQIVRQGCASKEIWKDEFEKAEMKLSQRLLLCEHEKGGAQSLLELELGYIRLAARMPQQRSLSLLNQALFLQLVRHDIDGSGAIFAEALRENPGENAAIRGYELFVNRGLLGCISPVQRRTQKVMAKKKAKQEWRRQTLGRTNARIDDAISRLVHAAKKAQEEFAVATDEYNASRALAKKQKEDESVMAKYRLARKMMKHKELLMKKAQSQADKAMSERNARLNRDAEAIL